MTQLHLILYHIEHVSVVPWEKAFMVVFVPILHFGFNCYLLQELIFWLSKQIFVANIESFLPRSVYPFHPPSITVIYNTVLKFHTSSTTNIWRSEVGQASTQMPFERNFCDFSSKTSIAPQLMASWTLRSIKESCPFHFEQCLKIFIFVKIGLKTACWNLAHRTCKVWTREVFVGPISGASSTMTLLFHIDIQSMAISYVHSTS